MSSSSVVVFWLEPATSRIPFPNVEVAKDLSDALKITERLRKEGCRHVTISTEMADCVTKPGVDSVEDGKTPDGHDYTWMKRRSQ